MPSPNDDWGYDVSDYYGVHPDLGSIQDLDRLIAEAARRDIRVLLDLVPNHTSASHPWFIDACSSRDAAHREFYVWADPAEDGGPPNNWRDFNGEPAWTFDPATGQYFLHKFLSSQPDLNWWHPGVHQAFESVLRFWLDRGIAGVRIDVAEGLYHDRELRDDPVAPSGDPRAEGGLIRMFSGNRPEVHHVYRDWRRIAERYSPPALLLGETWMVPLQELGAYYGRDDELQLAFNFPFILADFSARVLRSVVSDTLAALPRGACPIWAASNHDLSRFPTRWCAGDDAKTRVALALLATLPGALMLYYGDELGMVDVEVPAQLQRDKMAMPGQDAPSRDRARTPMQWTADTNAGFTNPGGRPWLPIGDAAIRNVAAQRDDPASVLSLVRALIALRRRELGDGVAGYEELPSGTNQWVYRSGSLVVAANLSDQAAAVEHAERTVVLSTDTSRAAGGRAHTLELGPWEAVITRS